MNSQVTVGTGSTLVLKPNSRRRRVILVNNSNEDMYVAMDSAALASNGVPLTAGGGSYVDEKRQPHEYIFKGQYTAICASGGKVLSVYEEDER